LGHEESSRTNGGEAGELGDRRCRDSGLWAVTRSDRSQVSAPAFDLPPRLVRLNLVLPNGSEPGTYDIEVRGADDRARGKASGNATLQDFITRLSIDIDLRSAPLGRSQLAIRRTGEGWQLFPVRVH
jgi:hypothetical protein